MLQDGASLTDGGPWRSNGKTLAWGGDSTVCLWDLSGAMPKELAILGGSKEQGPHEGVERATIAPGGKCWRQLAMKAA
jgi:hypothetical protein